MLAQGDAPAYNDAERGLVDVHAIQSATAVPAFNASQAPGYSLDEKKALGSPNFFPPPKEKESAAKTTVTVAPRPAAKKKKVSKWILWKLWFNTYRYARIHRTML